MKKCRYCNNPTTGLGHIYCFDCLDNIKYCNEICDPKGDLKSWHDEEKCQNCEHNSVKQNEPTPSTNEISSEE